MTEFNFMLFMMILSGFLFAVLCGLGALWLYYLDEKDRRTFTIKNYPLR